MNHHISPAEKRLHDGRGIIQTHRPAFWLMVLLFTVGAGMGIPSMATTVAGNPISGGVSLILVGAFGAIVFALIAVFEYLDPKPPSILAAAFGLGALVTTIFAQILSIPLPHMFSSMISNEAVANALAAATGEEVYKSLAVVVIFLVAPWWWNRLMDGLVIGAVVGLGFQMWEDVVYMVTGAGGATPDLAETLTIFFDRIVLTGFASHVAYTAIFGAALAYAMTRRSNIGARLLIIGGGFTAAWMAHAFWDSPILGSLTSNQGELILYSIIKSLPILLVVVFIGRMAYRELRGDSAAAAITEVDADTLTEEDIETLSTSSGRWAERKQAKASRGHAAADHVAHSQRAKTDLVRLYLHDLADEETVTAQRGYLTSTEAP